jgi:release factor glutamine methyltransferase
MKTYRSILKEKEQYALNHQKEPSAIKLLLLHVSEKSTEQLYMDLDQEMPLMQIELFQQLTKQYVVEGFPVQHLIGFEYFYGYPFIVNENVLIPRYETEELAQNILLYYDEFFDGEKIDAVDIGTGSGCLGIAVSLEEPNIRMTATDISAEALSVAKQNNTQLKGNVTFLQGDMLKPVIDYSFDLLISNPPYIPNEEYVESLVKDHEPHVALFGGVDGLDFYRKIIKDADKIMKPKFMMAFEHAFDKAEELKKLILSYFPEATVIQKKDMQGKDRMTFVFRK